MNIAFDIDFQEKNVRARVPAGSQINGESQFSTGLLVEGTLSGTVEVDGALVVLEEGVVSGNIKVAGDVYILGHVKAERFEAMGTVYVGDGAVVTGYVIAKDYQLFAGADVKGSLHKLG